MRLWYKEQKMQDNGKEVKEKFIIKFRCIMTAMIMAGIFLTACGSRVEEETEQESPSKGQNELQTEMQPDVSTIYHVEPDGTEREITEEEDIRLRGEFSADEIINELVKEKQQFSNDEGETENTLPDITWDDYHSGSYETWLHFSFSDGAQLDKELQYSPSIVKKVDFVDITGDGTDEVLVYRYFANTATEYTLINFFQMEENGVIEISPELEIEELANNVWSVIDTAFSENEYDMPVLTMESYVKENMLTYPDKRVLVGYQAGRWQILKWFDCPEPDFE